MTFKYNFDVKGYELDSFGHVNNSVYLNYLEQARWEIMKELGLYEYFKKTGSFLILIEANIKYIKELCLFEKAFVETSFKREGFFLVFKQNIKDENGEKVSKASVKCLFVDKTRTPLDIPQILNEHMSNDKS
jgi:YbgC/YbaW family acyl-CoA thioester hydrolase